MKDDQYILADNLVTYGYGEDKRVRPLIESDDDNLYDYYDDVRKSQKEKIYLTSERKKEITESIDSIAKRYKLLERQDNYLGYDFVMIPLSKILAIANNATERIFALNYTRDSGYQIRGKDFSLVDEFDNYHLITERKNLSTPQPYSEIVQKKLIEKYFKYKRIEKVLKKLCSSEISLAEFVDSNDYSSLDFQISDNFTEMESVLKDLQEDCIRIRNKLVEHNLGLVYKYFQESPRFRRSKEQEKDNMSTAYMLTIAGVDAYLKKENNQKMDLSTFIYNHLDSYGSAIKKINDNESLMNISKNDMNLLNKYRMAKRMVEERDTTVTKEEYDSGKKPSTLASRVKIANILGCSPNRVEELEILDDQLRNLESYDEWQERKMEEAFESGWIDEKSLDYDEPNNTDLYHLANGNVIEEEYISNVIKELDVKELWKILD